MASVADHCPHRHSSSRFGVLACHGRRICCSGRRAQAQAPHAGCHVRDVNCLQVRSADMHPAMLARAQPLPNGWLLGGALFMHGASDVVDSIH